MANDPSRAARAELHGRAAETVVAIGQLARLVGKSASSPALQSTVAAFAECESTMDSTQEMLTKIQRGLLDLDVALDECAEAADGLTAPSALSADNPRTPGVQHA